jgi:hypothetical protein
MLRFAVCTCCCTHAFVWCIWWHTLIDIGVWRRNGDSAALDDEERHKRDGNVGATGGGSDKGQHGMKT